MVKLVPAGGGALSGEGAGGSEGWGALVPGDGELVEMVSTVLAIDVSPDFSVLTAHPSEAHNTTI